MFKCILLILLLNTLNFCVFALNCVDHNNNPIDWYVMYKLPKQPGPNSLIDQGSGYTFITSNDANGWTFSNISINDTDSIIGLTLAPLFKSPSDILQILYNDENPDGSIMFKKGHTKGVVLGNEDGGLWLVHSVPRFPPMDMGKYYYPHNAYEYGQSFLCISLDLNNLDKVGTQLQYNMPNIFSRNMPENLKAMLPNIVNVLDNITVKAAPWYHLQMLKSQAGLIFFSFAKSPKFIKELYIDWVAPTLNASLLVETWPNGPGRLPSQCGKYNVYNVQTINMSVANCIFKTTNDHSKWAVVTKDNLSAKWICIGDINRAAPQRHRGGGTVCFSSGSVELAYQKIIGDIQPCP